MDKKYVNSLKLDLPTGDYCLRVNAELQTKMLRDAEEYADNIWDKVGGRILSAYVNATANAFGTQSGITRACFDKYFITRNVFNFTRKEGRSDEEIKAIVDVWHMFKSLPGVDDSTLNEYYSELLMEKLRKDLESYGYAISFSGAVYRYWPFFNPDESGGRTHEYMLYITPLRMDFVSRSRRQILKILQNIQRKLDQWFPAHEPSKRA